MTQVAVRINAHWPHKIPLKLNLKDSELSVLKQPSYQLFIEFWRSATPWLLAPSLLARNTSWSEPYFGEEPALCSFFAPTTQVLMDGSSIAKVQSLGVCDVRHAMTAPTLILHVLLCSPALRLSTRHSWCLGAVRALLPLGDRVGSGRICSNLSKILILWQFESVESLPKQKVWHDSNEFSIFWSLLEYHL